MSDDKTTVCPNCGHCPTCGRTRGWDPGTFVPKGNQWDRWKDGGTGGITWTAANANTSTTSPHPLEDCEPPIQ